MWEGLLAARQSSARIAIATSALATFPYVAYMVALILFLDGPVHHNSKLDYAIFAAVTSLVLWMGSATILTLSALVTRNKAWLFAPLALLVFLAIALAILDGPLPRLFDLQYGLGAWVFLVGILSTASYLILGAFKRTSAVR